MNGAATEAGGPAPAEVDPQRCLHRRVELVGESLRCRRCGEELHGVAYVEEMWATLWGIWQHCEPQRPDEDLPEHYIRMLGAVQHAAGDCLTGKGSAEQRGFDMIVSAGYGGEPEDPEEIVVSPEAMPPLPWEKRKRQGDG